MADFTLSQIGGPSGGSSVPVQQGVQEPSGVEAVSSLFSGLAQGFAQSQPSAAQQQAAIKEQKYSVAGSRFANQQLQIANAVDQGRLSSQEARMRMRANYASAVANNPELVDELTSLHKGLIGTKGLGAVAAEGTAQEQAFMKAQEQATLSGWVTSDMSQQEAQAATMNFMQFNRAQEMIDAEQNRIALERANLGLQTDRIQQTTARYTQESARLNVLQKQQQLKGQQAVGQMGDAYMPKFRQEMNQVLKQLQTGQISDQEAVDIIDGQWASLQQSVAQVGSQAGSEYISNMMAPMKFVYESARQRATGELSNELYANRIEKATAMQTNLLLGDPDMARLAAVSRLFPNSDVATIPAVNAAVSGILQKNARSEGAPANIVDPDSGEDTATYFRMIKDNIKASSSGDMIGGQEAETELSNNINNVLKGINAYSAAVDNPTQYNQVVDFIASPDFGQYVTSGGGLNKEAAGSARQVLMQQYEQEVIPLLEQEWSNAQVTTSALGTSGVLGTTAETERGGSIIEPVWSGTGMSFVAKDRSNTRVTAKVKELNKKVAPIVNKLIRMGAHLEGTQNYKQVYEANYAGIFGRGQEEDESQ